MMTAIRDKNGNQINCRRKVIQFMEEFCKNYIKILCKGLARDGQFKDIHSISE